MRHPTAADTEEPLGLGLFLTMVQISVFFGFLLMGCFAPGTMQANVPGLGLPLSFVFGLAVIACGVMLTITYVLRTNASEG